MLLKIKKLVSNAVIPQFAKEGDAGMDLVAVSAISTVDYVEYGTGLSLEIEQGHVGLIFPRSSISKTGHRLLNSVGVIDSGYRGEVKVRMSHTDIGAYEIGDRIAQLVIMELPRVVVEQVTELSDSERGDGGFGSTNVPVKRVWKG
jgi:dUTP pyrophosphatase